jgi:hypothetical protein
MTKRDTKRLDQLEDVTMILAARVAELEKIVRLPQPLSAKPDWLTIKQVMGRTGLSNSGVRKRIERKNFIAMKSGGSVFVDPKSVSPGRKD